MVAGVRDEGGGSLRPGDIVRLPLCVRHGSGPDIDVPGTVMGFAFGKDGMPSVVVDAPAWASGRVDSWRTWVVRGGECMVIDSREAWRLEAMYDRSGRLRPRGSRGK